MRTLLTFMPNPTDATSLYRGVGPFHTLKRKMGDINVIINPELNWASLKMCDAVFLQRPGLDHHVRIVDMAHANSKPVWVDYDDDLFRVPLCNRAHSIYSKAKIQNNMLTIIAKADIVTVSTTALKDLLVSILTGVAKGGDQQPDLAALKLSHEKIHVVPNAYDDEILAPLEDVGRPSHQNKIVAWRGSATHDKDLMLFTSQICDVVRDHLDWTYNLIGAPFWWTVERVQEVRGVKPTNLVVSETMDPADYFGFLTKTRPEVMIVPLEDIPFNRCKSNIAWVEATHAGAVTIAPDWDEWRRPGVITYKDKDDFKAKLESVVRGELDTRALWRMSRDFIASGLTLTRVNDQREALLRKLMEGRRC